MDPPNKGIPKLLIPKLVIRAGVSEEGILGEFSQLSPSFHSTSAGLLSKAIKTSSVLTEENSLTLKEILKNLTCVHLQEFENFFEVAAQSPILDRKRDLLRLLNAHHDHWKKLAFIIGWSEWIGEAHGAQTFTENLNAMVADFQAFADNLTFSTTTAGHLRIPQYPIMSSLRLLSGVGMEPPRPLQARQRLLNFKASGDSENFKVDQELASLYFSRDLDQLGSSTKASIDGTHLVLDDSSMDLNIKLRLYPHEQRARWYIEAIKSFDKTLSAALNRIFASRWLDQGEGKMQNLLSIVRTTILQFREKLIVKQVQNLVQLVGSANITLSIESLRDNRILSLKAINCFLAEHSPIYKVSLGEKAAALKTKTKALTIAEQIVKDFLSNLLQERLARLAAHLQSDLFLNLVTPFALSFENDRIGLTIGKSKLAEILPLIDTLQILSLAQPACHTISYQQSPLLLLKTLCRELRGIFAASLGTFFASLPDLQMAMITPTSILTDALGPSNGLYFSLSKAPKSYISFTLADDDPANVSMAVKSLQLDSTGIQCKEEAFGCVQLERLLSIMYNLLNPSLSLISLLSLSQHGNVLEMQQVLSPCCFILEKLRLVQSGLLLGTLKDGSIEVVNAPLLPPIVTCRVSPVAESQKLRIVLEIGSEWTPLEISADLKLLDHGDSRYICVELLPSLNFVQDLSLIITRVFQDWQRQTCKSSVPS